MKKLVFSFMLILLLIIPVSAFADTQMFSFSFESENEAEFWSGCFYDESNPYGTGNSIFVNNPFGEVRNEKVTHVLEYSNTIHLEAGKVYTLSGYILNPLSGYSPSIRTNAHLENGANTVIVNINGIGDEWAHFSTTFYSGSSGEYNLALHLGEGLLDFGFFMDEITLSETSVTLGELRISGQSDILIPAEGEISVRYMPQLITTDNKIVNILSNNSVHISATAIEGVSFNPSNFTLTVSSLSSADSTVVIECALRNFESLPPTSLKVELSDNMIDNPTFNDETIPWTTSSKLNVITDNKNSYIGIPTNDYGDYGYFSTLLYDKSQVLLEGVLYVMHARVKSDCPIPFSAIYAKNTSQCIENTAYFNIMDISGEEWIDVFAAFVPEASGIYNIALNLFSTYDCTIFVDDIRLSSEIAKSEYITLHAPGNIALPDVETQYNVSAFLRDQLGNILDDNNITVSLQESSNSLYFDSQNNVLTVLPDALPGVYTLTAYYNNNPSIYAQLSFTVSFDYIGDGGFEQKQPNEWWMVTSPYEADFYIRDDGYSKRALINCKGDYFMLLNNSYVHLIENTPYVFNSSFSAPVDCTATLFIETTDSSILPLAQFFIKGGTTLSDALSPELFLAEDSCVGRLFLYIQSDGGGAFSIYADNLSLKKAVVVAGNPHISGSAHINGAAEAEFSFYNSVTNSTDSSASVINWYVSDSSSFSGFKMLDVSGPVIYFDTTFFNKYVYFEVIPVCPVTGFSGNTIRCMPFLITYPDDKVENSNSVTEIISIPELIQSNNNTFNDISGHWGKDYINLLYANNIINGKSAYIFAPDDAISRSEFAKILCNTFSIKAYADFSPFEDIRRSDWFYTYVCALNLNGIINGVSESEFSPNTSLTREDAAVILMRIYEKAGRKTSASTTNIFSDSSLISPYATDSVNAAALLGIINGTTNNTFAPKEKLSRAQAAALVCRLVEKLSR